MKAFKSDAMRFTLPVIAENIFTTGVGLIYSAIVGGHQRELARRDGHGQSGD